MIISDIPESEYIVFDYGSFDDEQENCRVEERIENAMATLDYPKTKRCLDTSPSRIMYFYYHSKQYFKYIGPVRMA